MKFLFVFGLFIFVIFFMYIMRKENFYTGPHPMGDYRRNWISIPMLNCQDELPQCRIWASGNECKYNPDFMFKMCPKSCGVCGLSPSELKEEKIEYKLYDYMSGINPCFDRETKSLCERWQGLGYCQDYPTFMRNNCGATCGFCDYVPQMAF